jgi:hypothetical protein
MKAIFVPYRAFVHMSDGQPIGVYLVPEDDLDPDVIDETVDEAVNTFGQPLHNIVPDVCDSCTDLLALVREKNEE